MKQYIIFEVERQKIALPLKYVERVTRIVSIKPLSQASRHSLGVIDVQGTIISVISLRSLLDLPKKEVELSDILLIIHHLDGRFALLVDHVITTTFGETKACEEPTIIPRAEALDCFVETNDGFLPCYSLEALFKGVECDLQPSS